MAGIIRNNQVVDVDREQFELACVVERDTRMRITELMSSYLWCMKCNDGFGDADGDWIRMCRRNANAVKLMLLYAEKQHWSYSEYQNNIREALDKMG